MRTTPILAAILWAGLLAAPLLLVAEAPVVIEIRKYKFTPDTVTIKVGNSVKWVNAEKRASHSVLFKGGAYPESERMLPGESWQHRFDRPGTFPYSCGPHPEMLGTVIVTE